MTEELLGLSLALEITSRGSFLPGSKDEMAALRSPLWGGHTVWLTLSMVRLK
jgi:hypothetical protein